MASSFHVITGLFPVSKWAISDATILYPYNHLLSRSSFRCQCQKWNDPAPPSLCQYVYVTRHDGVDSCPGSESS